jgi:hypothetical protein
MSETYAPQSMPRSSTRTKIAQAAFRAGRAAEAWNGCIAVLSDIAHDDPAYAGPRIDRVENIAAAIDLVRQLIMLEAAGISRDAEPRARFSRPSPTLWPSSGNWTILTPYAPGDARVRRLLQRAKIPGPGARDHRRRMAPGVLR